MRQNHANGPDRRAFCWVTAVLAGLPGIVRAQPARPR